MGLPELPDVVLHPGLVPGTSPTVVDEGGRLVVRWPDGYRQAFLTTPEAVEFWARYVNELRDRIQALEEAMGRPQAPPSAAEALEVDAAAGVRRVDPDEIFGEHGHLQIERYVGGSRWEAWGPKTPCTRPLMVLRPPADTHSYIRVVQHLPNGEHRYVSTGDGRDPRVGTRIMPGASFVIHLYSGRVELG
jgi:hypothetical protein